MYNWVGAWRCPPVIPWHSRGYCGVATASTLGSTTERDTRLLLATICPFQVMTGVIPEGEYYLSPNVISVMTLWGHIQVVWLYVVPTKWYSASTSNRPCNHSWCFGAKKCVRRSGAVSWNSVHLPTWYSMLYQYHHHTLCWNYSDLTLAASANLATLNGYNYGLSVAATCK